MSLHKMNFSSTFLFIAILMCLSLAWYGTCIDINQTLNYTECTPERKCLSCLNEYVCKQCAPSQNCCPKRCLKCSSNTVCSQCEPGFQLKAVSGKGWTVCANSDSQTKIDYHRLQNQSIPQYNQYGSYSSYSITCQKGYYYESTIKFCQKCKVENCLTCKDSIHCFVCQNGFFLFNGLCLTWKDVQSNLEESNKDNQVKTNQSAANSTSQEMVSIEQMKRKLDDAYQFFLILGLFVGCCLTCILVAIYSCIKGCCKKCWREFFPKEQEIIFIEEQIKKHPVREIEESDKRSKNTQASEMNESFQSQSISDHVIDQSKAINKK